MSTDTERARHNAWARNRRRQIAYGTWQPEQHVSTDAARDHVNNLRRRYGLSIRAIAAQSGVPMTIITAMMYPNHHQHTRRITTRTEAALLAVRFDPAKMPPMARVSSVGTRRRVEALATQGWSHADLARRLGTSTDALRQTIVAGHASAAKAAAIAALYDELWDSKPPATTPEERRIIARTINRARRNGFASSLAWDEDTIDDVTASPEGVGVDDGVNLEDVEWLASTGETWPGVERRLGYTRNSIEKACDRAERKDLVARISANAQPDAPTAAA